MPFLSRLVTFPRTVLIGAGVLTVFSLWALPRVGFDYNVLNLQAKNTESVVWERRILASTGRAGFNGLSSARTLDELRARQAAFEKLPSVADTESVLRVLPDDQAEKVAVIKSFAPLVAPIRVGRSSPVDIERLKAALRELRRRFDIVVAEAGDKLPPEVAVVRERTIAVLRLLERSKRDSAEAALNYLQSQLYRDFVNQFYDLQRNLNPTIMTLKDVPEEVRRRFIGANGLFLIEVQPRLNIWEKAGAAQFVRELRTVDPDVTGPPVITYEATVLMERAYLTGSAYAFVLVGGLSLLMIRRLRVSLLGLLPMGLGVLWTIGLMHVFGIQFNLANIWGLPLIIGTAAEFGLNVILSHLEGRAHGGPLVARSAVLGVTLNGLTTIVGFGSLMIATHQGIFSLGLLLTLGTACGLVAALIVLPVLLSLISKPVERPALVTKESAA
jgi:predicted RND superfamily exporter protein